VPRQNRVSPLGELIATPARGLVYGNRGCLHDAQGRIRRHHATRRWIACELFFLDEATAFAAGHRPCALCRREDYDRFRALLGEPGADALDARLHEERGRLRDAELASLPDGAFVLLEGEPWLVRGDALRRWTPAGYAERRARGTGTAQLITAPSLAAVLAQGWSGAVPLLHPSAED